MDGFSLVATRSLGISMEYSPSPANSSAINTSDLLAFVPPPPVSERPSTKDSLQLSTKLFDLSPEEVERYFSNTDVDDIRRQLDEVEQDFLSGDNVNLYLLRKLYSLDNNDAKARDLRRLLRDIDQSTSLQEILFGDKKPKVEKVDLEAEFQFSFSISLKQGQSSPAEQESEGSAQVDVRGRVSSSTEEDPLVFDLGGDGIQTTGVKKGIQFDLDGDGKKEQISFVAGDDFALALDKNKNGRIDSGKELFGNLSGAGDGIEDLRRYDDNGDGLIDAKDKIFGELRLVNQTHSAMTLNEAGVAKIELERKFITGFTQAGDRFDGAIDVQMKDGSLRQAQDLWLQSRRLNP